MDIFEAVRTVRAIRHYRPDSVPVDALSRILEAARLTGSSMNAQPWHFIVVEDRATIDQLATVYEYGHYISEAPLVIAVLIERGQRFAVSDASRAIQSMVLTAWSEGIGSNFVGFFGLEAARPMVGAPESHEIFALLPFGYPLHPPSTSRKKRKPLAEIASRERFGEPYS
jgi:nitroreductase